MLNRPMCVLSKKEFLRLVSNHFLLSRSWNFKQHSLGFLQDIVIADPEHRKSLLLLEFCESELYPGLFFWRRICHLALILGDCPGLINLPLTPTLSRGRGS